MEVGKRGLIKEQLWVKLLGRFLLITRTLSDFLFLLSTILCLQVGMAMSSTEERAYEIMRMLDVNYVLVIFGGMIGYSGDDINKFLWMVRIAEGEHPHRIKVVYMFYAYIISVRV